MTAEEALEIIYSQASERNREGQARFKIGNVNNVGLSQVQIAAIAKQIGRDHALALALWKTGVHEAKHVASLIADRKRVTEKMMELWLKDFDSWDIVDGCCGKLFDKTPFAYDKAIEWTSRKGEFQKRAGFAMMAMLAVHDKKADDEKFEQFFPYLERESDDDRNFVKKAVNWAIRQIGKRNVRLCKKCIALSKKIQAKGDRSSKWIAADALRELEKYLAAGRISG